MQGLLEALLAWVLTHSVFNLKYATDTRLLGIYVQKLVIKIDDGTKVPSRAAKLFACITRSSLK